jgi:hypothetical protein
VTQSAPPDPPPRAAESGTTMYRMIP